LTRQSRRLSRLLVTVLLLSFSAAALSFIYKMNHQPSESAPPVPTVAPSAVSEDSESSPATQPSRETAPPSIDAVAPAIEASAKTPPSPLLGATTQPAAYSTSPETSMATQSVSSLLSSAQAEVDNGQFLQARGELNDALQAGNLDTSQTDQVKKLLGQISQVVVFSPRRFPDDLYGGVYVVQPGDNLARIANAHDCTWELLSRINGIEPRHLRSGASIKVIEGPFFAVVEKHAFRMDIYLGGLPGEKSSMFVTSYPVGLGQDDSTPVGTWMIEPHRKLKHPTYYSPRGEGVIAADDPKNPLGGYWIGLTGTEGQAIGKMSYGIHGTIDPNSIGKQSSMGCIRMGAADIAMVFDMMVEGKSMVVVKE
jgi:lipoprotein-anchoring transpeptidase ErfK/SrfK